MGIRTAVIVFVLTMPLCVMAQQENSSPTQEDNAPPEEVVVTGVRARSNLRMQVLDAERNAYDLFNKFNDDKRFKISCGMYQLTGSLIEKQICQPAFERKAMGEHAQDYVNNLRALLDPFNLDYSPPVQYQPVVAEIARHQKAYKQKLKQVAEEHPEFLEAIIQYSKLREQYKEVTSMRGKEN